MRDFRRDNRSGGRGRSFGDGNRGGGFNRNFARPTMHKAICSKCGKECEVPFIPTGDKPVFCRECFRENGKPADRKSDTRNHQASQYTEQFASLSAKLDKVLRLLETHEQQHTSPSDPVENEEEITTTKKKSVKKAS